MSAAKEFESMSLGRTSINFEFMGDLKLGVISENRDFHTLGDIIH